jgi:hypothetical protein
MMSEANQVKKYSIDGIFTESEKIKLIVMPDERKIVREITKR